MVLLIFPEDILIAMFYVNDSKCSSQTAGGSMYLGYSLETTTSKN